jgi:5-methyltetrahydropteroyltriglutamate--homocysteine methyltransferase
VQVDAPALRELLPLRAAHRPAYVAWPVDAFRIVTGGGANSAQVHTHLCCSEFGDVVEAIDGLDAAVMTLEVARTRMEVLADLGPGMPRARARDVRLALPTGAPTPRCANIPSPGRSP